MSTPNQLSVVIPQTVIDDVTHYLKQSKALLMPYLQGLTAQDRMEMLKMGDKNVTIARTSFLLPSVMPDGLPHGVHEAHLPFNGHRHCQIIGWAAPKNGFSPPHSFPTHGQTSHYH